MATRSAASTTAHHRLSDRQAKERSRVAKQRLLGSVIRETRGELTQAELGVRMGELWSMTGEPIPQSTISRWEKGLVDLTISQIQDLERVLQVRPGTLLLAAGMIDPGFSSKDVENVLRADPKIHPDFRADVVRFYKSYVDMSTRLEGHGPVLNGRRPRR